MAVLSASLFLFCVLVSPWGSSERQGSWVSGFGGLEEGDKEPLSVWTVLKELFISSERLYPFLSRKPHDY